MKPLITESLHQELRKQDAFSDFEMPLQVYFNEQDEFVRRGWAIVYQTCKNYGFL